MSKNYELMAIISPKLSEDEANALNESILALAKGRGGVIVKTDAWGKRMLAYPINKLQDAYYYVNYLTLESAAVKDIKHQMNINETILRHMFVARD